MNANALLRLPDVIGNPDATPPVPALIPLGRTAFLKLVRDGKFPRPVRIGDRAVAWRAADVLAWIAERQPTTVAG